MLIDILKESPAYQEIFAQGFEKGRQERMQELRQMLMTFVTQRFPNLERLAKGQLSLIKQPQTLTNLILKMISAHTQEEAHDYLLTCGEEDDAEEAMTTQ